MLILIELELKGHNIQLIKQLISKEYEQEITFFKEWKKCENIDLLIVFTSKQQSAFRYRPIINVFLEFLDDEYSC